MLVSSILGTTAYIVALREVYSWWVVAPVTLVALPIAMILTFVVMQFAGTRIGRVICLGLGGTWLWTAATHEGRTGSALMGIFLMILGATARKTGRWI